MHFRPEYIIAGFEFWETEIKVFDSVKQITAIVQKPPTRILRLNLWSRPDSAIVVLPSWAILPLCFLRRLRYSPRN